VNAERMAASITSTGLSDICITSHAFSQIDQIP
jgi:hypothetical protein